MNWSRASRATGVRSFQLNGTPVWSGVVKRFESVMMIVWGSPFLPLTSRNPSAPAPPALLTTMTGRGDSLCLSEMPEMRRAIWSAPPPVPAGTTSSIGLVGSQAAAAGPTATSVTATATRASARRRKRIVGPPCRKVYRQNAAGSGAVPRPTPLPVIYVATPTRRRLYFAFRAALAVSTRLNGMTPGTSHLSHISSTLAWK